MTSGVIVAPKFPKSIPKAIALMRHVASQMKANAYFPSPPVSLATFEAHIDALDRAHAAVPRRAGGAARRDVKLDVARRDYDQLVNYVQMTARQHGAEGPLVIASAGMSRKRTAGPKKPLFAVTQLKVSGSVRLSVLRLRREEKYEWQRSPDGVHYIDLGGTTQSWKIVASLPPGSLQHFRYRRLDRDGLGDWSDPIAFRVV